LTWLDERRIIDLVPGEWWYVALLDKVPKDMKLSLETHGWKMISPLPSGEIRLANSAESAEDCVAARQALQTILEQSTLGATILSDTHQPVAGAIFDAVRESPSEDFTTSFLIGTDQLSQLATSMNTPWLSPGIVSKDPHRPSTSDGHVEIAKSDVSAPPAKAAEPAPASSELAELVEKGLPALAIPDELWTALIDKEERAAFAKATADDLYKARIAYAQRVGWVVAPELELLDRLDRQPQDPHVTAAKAATKALLETRVDTAKSEADLIRKDVELKTELLKQQAQVTQLLAEFLKQAQTWRILAATGKHFLVGLTLFATAVTGFLAFLVFDGKLDPWAFPAAVFVLALFALSPAVLLMVERPLKGIDQWMPGGKAQDDQAGKTPSSADTSGAKATTPPTASASGK
jgi:hypothetical protein